MGISTVTAVQTQGQAPYADWVTTFRLQYSLDCVMFTSVLLTNGTEAARCTGNRCVTK